MTDSSSSLSLSLSLNRRAPVARAQAKRAVRVSAEKDKGKDNCTGRYYLILMSSMLVMVVASALTFVLLYNTRLYITNLLRL